MTRIAIFQTPKSVAKSFFASKTQKNCSTQSAHKSSEAKPKLSLFGRIKACVNSEIFPETLLKAGSALMVTGAALTGVAAFTGGFSVAPGVALLATGGLLYGAGLVVTCIQKYTKGSQAAENSSASTIDKSNNMRTKDVDDHKSWPSTVIENSI